jgi:hypothetical protein
MVVVSFTVRHYGASKGQVGNRHIHRLAAGARSSQALNAIILRRLLSGHELSAHCQEKLPVKNLARSLSEVLEQVVPFEREINCRRCLDTSGFGHPPI